MTIYPGYDPKKFAALLQECREVKGLTKAAISKHLGVDPSIPTKLENGTARPSQKMARSLAKLLDQDPEKILIFAGYLPHDIEVEIFRLCQEKSCAWVRQRIQELKM